MSERFLDRRDAGRALGGLIAATVDRSQNWLVLGLARGGIPVASEVADVLGADLDVFVVRKLGVPGHEELAMGAIASGGITAINESVVAKLNIETSALVEAERRERAELARREGTYRGSRADLDVEGQSVVLVDDGIATGASMRVAVEAVMASGARTVVVGVPVAPQGSRDEFVGLVDDYVVVKSPEPFGAVGYWYDDFTQTTDDEVTELLKPHRE